MVKYDPDDGTALAIAFDPDDTNYIGFLRIQYRTIHELKTRFAGAMYGGKKAPGEAEKTSGASNDAKQQKED